MGKILFVVASIALFVQLPNALASRSRLTALGQDSNGSFFIQDNRNVFLNPANVVDVENHVAYELGSSSVSGSPKAEGGMFYKGRSLNYGLQLGGVNKSMREMAAAEGVVGGAGGTTYFDPQNSFEVLVGSDGDMKWGASFFYANSESDSQAAASADSDAKVLTARGGIIADKFTVHGTFDVAAESTTKAPGSEVSYDGKVSIDLGGSFYLDDGRMIGASLEQRNFDFENSDGAKGDYARSLLAVDFYNPMKTEEGVLLFYTAGLTWSDATTDLDAGGSSDRSMMYLPVVIGVEAQANEWMVLRASVKQNVIIDDDKNDSSGVHTKNIDDTTVAAGLGITLNSFKLDATLSGADDQSGDINGNKLMSNVGITYTF